MFSVNIAFGETLIMQFCYFFLQKLQLFGLQKCKYSQLNLNTFALHSGTLAHALQRAGGAAVQQMSARKYSN